MLTGQTPQNNVYNPFRLSTVLTLIGFIFIIFINLQISMSAQQQMEDVMHMLPVQIQLVLIYANVTQDMMEMELIALVRNCFV